ncbi:MAG: helix-turn-helix domain-containing protein [Opitutaceae bacterium]
MQSIGERLEEARKKKGISIREAAEATKIRGDYLSQFENNRFDINLTEIYVRGFLRSYALYLKLPADKIINDYAALGRGEARPRQPSREVYGRMDVSIASADDRSDAVVAEETPPPQANHRPAPVSRGKHAASSTAIDPAVLFKFGKWAAIGVLVLLFIWGIVAIFNSSKSASATRTPLALSPSGAKSATAAPVESKTITLVALDTVRVTVVTRNDDDSEGEELFRGTLTRGQTQVVPWPGPIYIKANAGENLQIEYKGKRYGVQFTGNSRAKM